MPKNISTFTAGIKCWPSLSNSVPLIARVMGTTWGPSGTDKTQKGPIFDPWTLLCGSLHSLILWMQLLHICIVLYGCEFWLCLKVGACLQIIYRPIFSNSCWAHNCDKRRKGFLLLRFGCIQTYIINENKNNKEQNLRYATHKDPLSSEIRNTYTHTHTRIQKCMNSRTGR